MRMAEFLKKIGRKWVWLVYLLALGIPFIIPLGLPLPIAGDTRVVYNQIEALKEGDVVILWNAALGQWVELGSGSLAITSHLMEKPVKIIYIGEPFGAERIINEAKTLGKKYGIDYMIMPVVTATEPQLSAFLKDMRSVVTTDWYGTPLDKLKVMDGVNSAKDITIAIRFTTVDIASDVRQFVTTYHIPLVVFTSAGWYAGTKPYREAGQITALLAGLGSGAEYESISGNPGKGIAWMDSMSLSQLVLVIFIILANVRLVTERLQKLEGRIDA